MKVKSHIIIVSLLGIIMIRIPYLSQTLNNLINLSIEVMITWWLMTRKVDKETIKNNIFVIFFMGTMVVSTFINVFFASRLMNSIVTGYGYSLIFIVVDYFVRNRNKKAMVAQFFIVLSIMSIAELIAILLGGNFIGNDSVLKTYFLGNKFFVSYTHMLFLALFLYQKSFFIKVKVRRIIFIFLSIYVVGICHIVDCNTGVVGSCFMVILIALMHNFNSLKNILIKPYVYICFLISATILLVGTEVIVGNSFFQYLFVKYSHTNQILTGRLEMYKVATEAIVSRPMFGYGINCTIVEDVLSWGNAQNGILKMLLDYGVFGTLSFIMLCYDAFRARTGVHFSSNNFALVAFLYAMALCSTVEINISFCFIIGIALMKGENMNCGGVSRWK